jgi:hypothetical protein
VLQGRQYARHRPGRLALRDLPALRMWLPGHA